MMRMQGPDAEMRRMLARMRPGGAQGEGRSDDEAWARIAWSVLAEPGDGVAGALITHLGAVDALVVALEEEPGLRAPGAGSAGGAGDAPGERALAEARSRWMPRARESTVRAALNDAAAVGARLLLPGDDAWPEGFADLGAHAPHLLWVRGDVDALRSPRRIALVGARAATAYGERIAAELAGDLAGSGALIVSGGAYGIDGAAHRAALGAGGSTLAFLAGGIDRAYPAGHQRLFQQMIAEGGAVASEVPAGTAPTKWRFLARNRLIAALAQATVVVEAGRRSGTLNTAGHAATLGRPLGSVPGPVTSAASAGCHRLLREFDARCVTDAAEVRELLRGEGSGGDEYDSAPRESHDNVRLLDALSTRTARDAAEIARRSGLAPGRVRGLLGVLALEGRVVECEGGWCAPARG